MDLTFLALFMKTFLFKLLSSLVVFTAAPVEAQSLPAPLPTPLPINTEATPPPLTTAQPLRNIKPRSITEVSIQTERPDGETVFSIRQGVQFQLKNSDLIQTITVGYSDPAGTKKGTFLLPLRYSVQNEASQNQARFRGTVGVDLINGTERAAPFLQFEYTQPLSRNSRNNRSTASLVVTSQAVTSDERSIDRQIRNVLIAPRIDWYLNKKTNVLVSYQYGLFNDGNFQQQFTLRLEHQLGSKGAYVAGQVFLIDTKHKKDSGYWTPQDYLASSVELGWRTRLSNKWRCQIGVRPTFITEDQKDSRFRFPGGFGCVVKLSQRSEIQFSTTVGYGVTSVLRWTQFF